MQDVCQRPTWPKHPASVVIDSATYLLMISSPDIDNVAMSLYDTPSMGTKGRGGIEEDWTERRLLTFLLIVYSAIWGDHPGVYILYCL